MGTETDEVAHLRREGGGSPSYHLGEQHTPVVIRLESGPGKEEILVSTTPMPPHKLTPEIITAAILGFQEQRRQIDTKIAELRAWLTGGPSEPAAAEEPATAKKRRKMSAAARKRIGDAQRKRWAASKKAAEPSVPEAAPKPKRELSAAGRKAIIAATKKRWDAVRAAKPAPAKRKMSPARKAALVANLAKARAARAAKRGAAQA